MSKFLFISSLLSFGLLMAENQLPTTYPLKPHINNSIVKNCNYLGVKEKPFDTSTKFIYAELIYQRIYAESKFFVNGKNVSESSKKSVAQAKYSDEALDILGADGWELTAAYKREINSGSEYFFYLKKKIE